MRIKQAWTLGTDDERVTISGDRIGASKVTITVSEPGSGFGPTETPSSSASVTISADDFRELVGAVERNLILRGDPQR